MKLPGYRDRTGSPIGQLGRYNTAAAERRIEATGRVEGRAIADAGSMLGRAITSAGRAVAQGRYEAEQRKNEIIKRDEIRRSQLKIESRANMLGALLNTAVNFGRIGLSLYEDYKNEKDKAEMFEAQSGWQTEMMQTSTEMQERDSVYASEMPEGYGGDRYTPDGQEIELPLSESLPDLYKDRALKALDRHAATIQSESAKRAFIQDNQARIEKNYYSMVQTALSEQKKERRAMEEFRIDTMIDMGSFAGAANLIESSTAMSESEKAEKRLSLKRGAEIEGVVTAFAGDNDEIIQAEVDRLSPANDKYKGSLTLGQRQTYQKRGEQRIKDLETQRKNSYAGQTAATTQEVKDMITLAERGHVLSRTTYASLLVDAVKFGVDPILIGELNTSMDRQPLINAMHKGTAIERQALLQTFKQYATKPSEILFYDRMVKLDAQITQDLKNDPLVQAANAQVLSAELIPLTLDSPKEVADLRAMQKRETEANYGQVGRLTTVAEAEEFARNWELMDVNTRLGFLRENRDKWEHNAAKFFEEVGMDAPEMLVASFMNDKMARRALIGAEYRQEYKEIMPKDQLFHADLNNRIGNLFQTNPAMRSSYIEHIKNLYAEKAVREADFSGVFKKNWVRDIVKTSPVMEYKGQHFLAPEGMTTRTFKSWMKEVEPRAIVRQQVPGMQDWEVMDQIHRGNFVMKQTSRNEWMLIDHDTQLRIMRADKTPVIIEFDPWAPAAQNVEETLELLGP